MAMTPWKSRIAPELRGLFRAAPNWTWGPWRSKLFRALGGLAMSPVKISGDSVKAGEGVKGREILLNDQRIRLFQPEEGLKHPGAILWIHGGGRIVGAPELMDPICIRHARRLGLLTLSPSYSLAPEAPFPAALDDLHRAYHWLVDNAESLGIDPNRIAIGGESAGGGLAAELCQRLLDEGNPNQPKAQLLIYPMLDDRSAANPALTEERHLVWNNESNHYGWASYLGLEPGSASIPTYGAAARREDLSRLPPAWFVIGDLDLFEQETKDYAQRLKDGGVEAQVYFIKGGFHGCFIMGMKTPYLQGAWGNLEAFITKALDLG